ncbi:MAG: M23 family metallopeptidase [Candidatus Dojkabacteria bacterium]
MNRFKTYFKIIKSLDRSQILVASFLGVIIIFSSFNLIRDLKSYGIRPFGFAEVAFAQIFHTGDILASELPSPGGIPNSVCGDKIDLLQYMFAESAPSYEVKYCTKDGPGPSPQTFQVEQTTFEGHDAFKLKKNNDYELYYYDNQNIYFVEDTSWDGLCPNGQRAYYRVFGPSDQVGGPIPRCWSPGESQTSSQKIKRFIRDSDQPSGTACTNDFEVTNPTYQVDIASSGSNGPQISSLYVNNGTIVLRSTGGAGAGEEKYYSKGFGLTGFYFNNGGNVDFHSSIQTDSDDPTLKCNEEGDLESNLSLFSSPKQDIVDQPDRCVAFNPRTGKQLRSINSGGGTSLEEGKGGINQGSVGAWTDEINFVQGGNSLHRDLKTGNLISLFTGPDVARAADFITKTNDAGLLPIVRLCFVGGCAFNMYDNSIPKFYKDVSDAVGPDNVFVAILGPNEPGTANEMTAFGVPNGDYQTLVDHANDFAQQLQGYRVSAGGNMYLTPAVFNMTNRQNDDVHEYLSNNRGLNLGLFDYLSGNTYNVDNKSAYSFYVDSGMKQVVDSNGMKTLITEFGKFTGTNAELKDAFNKFCTDTNVSAVLFFRSFPKNELDANDPKPLPLSTSVIYDMTSSCSKPRPWVDCNFDSTIYGDNLNRVPLVSATSSTAQSVYQKMEDDAGGAGPTFKVDCGSGDCNIKVTQTMRLRAPIKEFGSNSSFGTETKNFVPICANVASMMNNDVYDPLNQFAGKIGDYPMPWLGSAINCSSELIKYSTDFSNIPALQAYINPGTVIKNTDTDIQGDLLKQNVAREDDSSTCYALERDGKEYIPDERTLFFRGQIVDKCPVNEVKIVRDYNPFSTPQDYIDVPEANSDLKYLKNSDDYIYGPEVQMGTQTVSLGNSSHMCSLYSERNVDPGSKLVASSSINCSVKTDEVVSTNVGTFSCATFAPCSDSDIKNGKCQLNQYLLANAGPEMRSSCFEYGSQGSDRIYYHDNSFAALPSAMDIPNIYDSLYRTYQRLSNSIKSRNLKLVVNNNLGWKVEGYSILRDGNNSSQEQRDSNFKATDPERTYLSDIENNPRSTATVTESNLFNNEVTLGRGVSSQKETDYYYDWLGNLDLFQEYWSVYQNNTQLSGEQRINNPFYQQGGEPNSERQQIVISGLASQYTSLPLLTCDQMEIGKKYTKTQLLGSDSIKNSIRTYLQSTDPKLTGDNLEKSVTDLINQLWPYDYKVSGENYNCITDITDNRKSNKFEVELCRRGYTVEGACERQCTSTPTTTPAGNISGTTCPLPTGHRCFQGATGDFTHCVESSLPADLYPYFVGGSDDPARRDLRVVAPESGVIQNIADNGNQGTFIELLGNSGILYKLQHTARSKMQIQVGDHVNVGQVMTEIATQQSYPGLAYDNNNIHLHVSATKDGQNIDPYYLYGQALGCNLKAPIADDGSPIPNGTVVGADSGYCVTNSDSGFKLQDNACSKPAGLTGDQLFSGSSTTPVSSPTGSGGTTGLNCSITGSVVSGHGDPSGKGIIGCDIALTNANENADFNTIKPYLDIYGRAYNSDSNQSYTFINDPTVYNFVVNKAKQLGINPRFVITEWLEETGGSAVGNWGLGCVYFRDGRPTGELGGLDRHDQNAMMNHISEQIDCLSTYISEFPDFVPYMCTYSGEVGRPNCTSFQNNPHFPLNICRISNEIGAYY